MRDARGLGAATAGVRRVRRWARRVALALDRTRRRQDEGFAELRRRFYRDYWAAAAATVGASCRDLGRDLIEIRRGDDRTVVQGYRVQLDDPVSLEMAGDKPLTTRLLAEAGLPTVPAFEFTLETLDRARVRLEALGGVGVVKPAYGTGGGHGVTTGIDTPEALARAAREASLWCRSLILEPQVEGHSVRVLLLHGELLDVVLRGPPTVVCDGRSSLRGLMEAETGARLEASPPRALSPLRVDLECRLTLAQQGLRLDSVPPSGARVTVKRVVNQNAAVENRRVPDRLHPSVVDVARAAAQVVGLELAGVDLVVPELGEPSARGRVRIGEVNSTPGLHHHALVADADEDDPVGPVLLEHLLSRRAEPSTGRGGAG